MIHAIGALWPNMNNELFFHYVRKFTLENLDQFSFYELKQISEALANIKGIEDKELVDLVVGRLQALTEKEEEEGIDAQEAVKRAVEHFV